MRLPTSRWVRPSRRCAPATSPGAPPTASSRWSAAAAASSRCSACASTCSESRPNCVHKGVTAFCTNDDDRLLVAAAGRHDERDVQRAAAEIAGVPVGAVRAVTVDELPLLSSGKPDYQTVRRLARATEAHEAGRPARTVRRRVADRSRRRSTPTRASSTSAEIRCRTSTMTVRLERTIGQLPQDWQRMTLRQLESISKPRAPRVGGDAGDQRGLARRGDRAHRRIARRAVRDCGAARTCCWASPDTTSAGSA